MMWSSLIENPLIQSPKNGLTIEIKVAGMTESDLCSYLHEVSGDYTPPLDMIVNLNEYSHKLTALGTLFSAEVGGNVVGILVGYFNNPTLGFAFISQFHVRKQFRRMLIGKMLMDKAVSFASGHGFKAVRLKVNKDNDSGLGFYKQYGFVVLNEDEKQFELAFNV